MDPLSVSNEVRHRTGQINLAQLAPKLTREGERKRGEEGEKEMREHEKAIHSADSEGKWFGMHAVNWMK